MNGYCGKFLRIDLSTPNISTENFDESILRKYLGGTGIGTYILYNEVSPEVEWSSPFNRLIIASGPLGGSPIGGSGSISIVTKGALTNGVTSVQANGFFGAYLRFCGFDGIILYGSSKNWVYLYIDEEHAELREADWLKGRDTYDTADLIKHEHKKKDKEMSVLSIGPAGENLVRFACIVVDKGHVAAHNGVGAVMGSKKLKAIAVSRGKKRPAFKNINELVEISNQLFENAKNEEPRTYQWGTLPGIVNGVVKVDELGAQTSYLPVKNYTTTIWPISKEELDRFSPQYIREKYNAKPNPCWACRMHHCHMLSLTEGPYAGEELEEPEYEQLASWGPCIGQNDVTAAMMLSKEVDRLGMDTNEASWVIAFLMECYEKGILSKEDMNNLDMKWGNAEAARLMLNLIARRQGIGDLLAEGVKRASEKIGGDAPNIAIYTLKGNTPRSHDHRQLSGPGWNEFLTTCVSSTGTIEIVLRFIFKGAHPKSGPQFWKDISTNMAKYIGVEQFQDSLVVCRFTTRYNVELLAKAVSASTGWDFTYDEAWTVGRRIVNLLRAFNLKHGIGAELDKPSPRYGSPLPDGPHKGISIMEYFDAMRKEYYTQMGWDSETGKPLPETLKRLNLEFVAKDIWQIPT
jgi:aldehyde:ferredoxin oxidoreductase